MTLNSLIRMNDHKHHYHIDPDTQEGMNGLTLLLIISAITAAMLFLFTACATKERIVEVETVKEKTVTKRDTIIQRDSIYRWDYDSIAYDTITNERTIWKWRTIQTYSSLTEKASMDSIRVDTIHIPVPVETRLTTWQTIRLKAFFPLLGIIVILFAVLWLIKRKN